jgi:AcrR family transcriptional regulator
MPKTREQNEAIKQKRRHKIMVTALKLFATNGFDKITIDDIVKTANCSHGLFYHYFKDKEEIFKSISEELMPSLFTDLTPRENEKAIDRIKLLVDRTSKIVSGDDEDLIYYARVLSSLRYSCTTCGEADKQQKFLDNLVNVISLAQGDGDIHEGNPNEIATIFCDFVNGAIERRIVQGKKGFTPVSSKSIMGIFSRS